VIIDVHAHAVGGMLECAGHYGPRYVQVEAGGTVLEVGAYRSKPNASLDFKGASVLNNASVRLSRMDEVGIDHLVLSTSPLFYLYWIEAEIAIESCGKQNDALAAASAADVNRFSWSATLPMQDIDASVCELRRALACGAKAVSLSTTDLGGHELDDPTLWPLYEIIESSGIPLILHPHPLSMATGEEDRYNLTWVVGYTYSETMAFARLVLGGVFDDFPRLNVVLPHGGGAVPYQIGRIQEAWRTQQDAKAKRPVRDYLGNFYFEILVHDVNARRLLLDLVGPSQLVVGSNFGGWDAANGVAMLDELDLPSADHDLIAYGNSARLFHLEHLIPS
jgi:aminocarboxymuconate-semialdehyde decarboxylase